MKHPLHTAILTCLISFGSYVVSFAQTAVTPSPSKEPWSFGVNGYYGALFRYKSGTEALNFTHPVGVELYANRHTLGKRQWERTYRYPQIGFAFSYYNYGMPEELGQALSLTTYLDNSILNFRNSSLRFNLGTGLVYSTRHYTPIENEDNKAVGSAFTFALRGTLRYEFPLSEKVYMNLNLAFRHFSNGALNKPNNGMNFPMIGMGLRYQPKETLQVAIDDSERLGFDKRVRFNLRAAAGKKEVLYIDQKHPVYSLSLYASKQVSHTSTILVGADGFYNSSLPQEFIKKGVPVPEGNIDPRMAGITIGHELHISDLSFVFQMGRYVYEPNKLYPQHYQRYGLKYNLTEHVSANVALLAHAKTAQVIEWGIGLHL
ncbi:acyloxyacyl hydrolase [Pontibacter rugosus]|uniref:Acyloxyacyl hydrolase n=1 Tax=Pontibacter rugosus TaxID=1745966 RepID=A0ABW3SNI0_9BACT